MQQGNSLVSMWIHNFLSNKKYNFTYIFLQGGAYTTLCAYTGHYLNFINSDLNGMGFAFGNISNTYGSIAVWTGEWSGSMPLDEYAQRVNDAYNASNSSVGQVYISDAGRTMIPLRLVSETMEYTTNWQPDGSIHITSQDDNVDVTLNVGSKNYIANGVSGTFETAPTLKDNRTYLPARDFTELYGGIYWDSTTRTVWVSQGKDLQYQAIGDKLLRADEEGISQLSLPAGYSINGSASFDPILSEYTVNGERYLELKCNQIHNGTFVQLFRDDGDHLAAVEDEQ